MFWLFLISLFLTLGSLIQSLKVNFRSDFCVCEKKRIFEKMSLESFNAYVCGIHEGKISNMRAGCSAYIVKAENVIFASKNCKCHVIFLLKFLE